MKTTARSTSNWGHPIAILVLNLLGASALSSCHTQQDQPVQPQQQALSGNELLHPTPRQQAIRDLAGRIRFYHEGDSIAAAKPGSTDGDIVDINHRRYVFPTRVALRADLNRVLDSLRKAGPLEMGNPKNLTDTTSDWHAAYPAATSTLKASYAE